MSTQRRHLVSRNRNTDESSPAPRPRQRASEASAPQRLELPPYEPPSFPLSQAARTKIENLGIEGGTSKYKKHIAICISGLSEAAPQCHERVHERKEQLAKLDARRKNNEEGEEVAKEYEALENHTKQLSKRVTDVTKQADLALRELIDYGDELAMQDTRIKHVIEAVTTAAAAQLVPRQRMQRMQRMQRNGDEDDEQEEDLEDAPEVLSTVNLLSQAHGDYVTTYVSKSMRTRYGENNDYKRFKQGIHEAANQGDDARPLSHARTWFPEENGDENGSNSRRQPSDTTNRTNDQDEDDDDDDIQIARVTAVTKCPLTLKFFEEPYSNDICQHIFEKSAIVDYINSQGTVYASVSSNGLRENVKRAKCPQAGCEQMLAVQDFRDDALALLNVKRQQRREENAQDEDQDDHAPRGTQSKPQNVDDDDESDGVDVDATPAKREQDMARIKRERQSRGVSVAPRHPRDPDIVMEDDLCD